MKKVATLPEFYFVIILLLFSSDSSYAQYVNVKINSSYVWGEEMIAMNPNNPSQLVVGTHFFAYNQQSNMGYFYSTNGGLNWSGSQILSTLAQPGGDPFIIVDNSGNFYYICFADWLIPPPNLDKMLCLKSTNGGANWNNGTAFAQLYPKFDDMPMACIDFSQSQFSNNLYVTWTLYDSLGSHNPNDSTYVYFSRSTDAGTSFNKPKRISKIAGNSICDSTSPEGPVPCTGTNGEIFVCYPHNSEILFTRSSDGGDTWLDSEIFVSTLLGGWPYHFSPVVACDLSNSPYRGTIYISYAELATGMLRDVKVITSTDGGDHWGNPVRVNDDGSGHMHDLPWMCVDRITGYIWIVFYDSRNHTGNGAYDTYVARSTDGGNTFQNTKISNSNSSTQTGVWLGDYIGITAYNNIVRPVWTTSIGYGASYLWTAIIDTFIIGIQSISSEVPARYSLSQNYPNPFNPSTVIRFQVVKAGEVNLTVYDITGKKIAMPVNNVLSPGSYKVTFDAANLSSGVYFYVMRAGNFTQIRKMVLIK